MSVRRVCFSVEYFTLQSRVSGLDALLLDLFDIPSRRGPVYSPLSLPHHIVWLGLLHRHFDYGE